MVTTRKTTADDLYAVTEIYNEAIINNFATFDTEPKTKHRILGYYLWQRYIPGKGILRLGLHVRSLPGLRFKDSH